jgi:hypothetical protein
MGFGRNPHVAKAKAAEQKADDARDEAARITAYRDAAHQWDRAAERERPGKQREEYEREAIRNRSLADGDAPADGAPPEVAADRDDDVEHVAPAGEPRLLN